VPTVRRAGDLWGRFASFENLWLAARKARRGKRASPAVQQFEHDLEPELVALKRELEDGSYRPGPYRTFTIHAPKPRLISAAPYRDRVVHHALLGVLEPVFERFLVTDTYACRKGKGTHAALDRYTKLARRYRYALQLDVEKFFPSIDHALLKARLGRKIKDVRVLALCSAIVDASNAQEPRKLYFAGDDLFSPCERRRGLPIGNLTSQWFASVYLDEIDHLVADRLGLGYVRYGDDMVAFADDKQRLHRARRTVEEALAVLRLRLKRRRQRVYPVTEGTLFLGFQVFPDRRRLDPANVARFRRRRAKKTWEQLRAWAAHAGHANTVALRRSLGLPVAWRSFSRGRTPEPASWPGRPARPSARGRVEALA
jgi:retron-type reverse transcriptase